MQSDDSADAIRRRMAELRQDLTSDVQDVSRGAREIADTAREMANPMFYVRRYPWVAAGAAAAVGYLLIPKKRPVIKPDPEMLAELVRKQQVKLDTSEVAGDKKTMLQSLVVMGLTWALKTGLNYAGQHLAAVAMNKGAPVEEHHVRPAPSPLEEPWKTTG